MMLQLIGPSPGKRGTGPDGPLGGAVGRKLADMCGLSYPEYLNAFRRINLLDDWPGKQGKGDAFFLEKARRATKTISIDCTMTVFLGTNAAWAFGLSLTWMRWVEFRGGLVAALPHPSGINLWYNDPENRERASRFMRSLIAKWHRMQKLIGPNSKLTPEQVRWARHELKLGNLTQKQVAEKLHVTQPAISYLLRRKTYRRVIKEAA